MLVLLQEVCPLSWTCGRVVSSGRPRGSDSGKGKIVPTAVILCASSCVIEFQQRVQRSTVASLVGGLMALTLNPRRSTAS